MSNISNHLLEQCKTLCNQIENETENTIDALFERALDLEFTIDRHGNYLGTRILCAFGGPNIWIDTRYGRIDGYWGNEHVTIHYQDIHDLHEYCEIMYPNEHLVHFNQKPVA